MTEAISRSKPLILVAEDDDDYFVIMKEAFDELGNHQIVHRSRDGKELMDYLKGVSPNGDPTRPGAAPALIFMDINMPRKNGIEALEEIKADPLLRHIPVVMLTISKNERDIFRSYQLGASSFIRKPFDFQDLVNAFKLCGQYWFGIVQLPISPS